ncbi:hypothetical protein Tco_0103752 [Tanacetum coccineum]
MRKEHSVLDLEKTKTTQANEIASLKRMVKKLEKKRSSRSHKLKRLYKVGLVTARVKPLEMNKIWERNCIQTRCRRNNENEADGKTLPCLYVQDMLIKIYLMWIALTVDEVFAEQESCCKRCNILTVDEVLLFGLHLQLLEKCKTELKGGIIVQRDKGEELEQREYEKQKVDEDKDTAELQNLMEVIPDKEEDALNVVPLAINLQYCWLKIHKRKKEKLIIR